MEIADAEYENIEEYKKFLEWCIKEIPISIFIETNEYNVFKLFGEYINLTGDETTYNLLINMGVQTI